MLFKQKTLKDYMVDSEPPSSVNQEKTGAVSTLENTANNIYSHQDPTIEDPDDDSKIYEFIDSLKQESKKLEFPKNAGFCEFREICCQNGLGYDFDCSEQKAKGCYSHRTIKESQ